MRRIASTRPGTGACTLASAMNLWAWTLNYLQKSTDPAGDKLYHGQRQGVTFALADALSWLMASRCQILDVLELETRGAADAVAAEGLAGTVQFLSDLCHTQAAQAAGEVSRICAELVFGYNRHPAWDEEEHRSCFLASELEELEETMPGIMAMAVDVLKADGSHPRKAGPCAGCAGSSEFLRLQSKLTTCLTGARLAKDRAAETVSKVMIPEALDYPGMSPRAQPVEIDRQTMEVDIACAGFGPATGGFLTTLTQAWSQNPADPAFESKLRRACRCRCSATSAPTIWPRASAAWSRAPRAFAQVFPRSIPPRFPWPRRSSRSGSFTCSIPLAPAGAPRSCAWEIFFFVLDEGCG